MSLVSVALSAICGVHAGNQIVDPDAPRPHIISIIQDDLGFYDTGIYNENATNWTHNITGLAKEGITLSYHYTHWHCSPTRRSFLSGRLPIHHSEQLSSNSGDDIDLRMTWVSGKLAAAGYDTHMFGKWHTGFRSQNHLPANRGFRTATGSLQTGGSYSGPKHTTRWQDEHPIWTDDDFSNPPPGCGSDPSLQRRAAACDASKYLNKTELPCGEPVKFVNVSDPDACCAECSKEPMCSHWVYQTGDSQPGKGNCHIKTGGVVKGCPSQSDRSTSGLGSGGGKPNGTAKCVNEYSTDLWGSLAVQAVDQYTPSKDSPLYVHLCFQAVHVPYDAAPGDPTGVVYRGMLWRADIYIGQIVSLLKSKGMWDNTVIVYTSDNGGVEDGSNYPLRGEKHSNWEGGMRTTAFVSGGFVPQALRGTVNPISMHVSDWYATFAYLAGVDTTDDPPEPPLPVDPSKPFQNIYGNKSFPPADAVNLWPMLMNPTNYSIDSAHTYLVLSKEVLIAGKYKLLVAQPFFKSQNSGWKMPDGTWRAPYANETFGCVKQSAGPTEGLQPAPGSPGQGVCLFDIRADPGEHLNLADQHPDIVATLWAALNNTALTQRDCVGWSYNGVKGAAIPGPVQPDGTTSCSPPELLGTCDAECAYSKWEAYGNKDGPICGVPGCV